MSSLQDRFAQAQQYVNRLPSRLDNDTMLKLYALYKQATKGDATGDLRLVTSTLLRLFVALLRTRLIADEAEGHVPDFVYPLF